MPLTQEEWQYYLIQLRNRNTQSISRWQWIFCHLKCHDWLPSVFININICGPNTDVPENLLSFTRKNWKCSFFHNITFGGDFDLVLNQDLHGNTMKYKKENNTQSRQQV